MVASAIVAGVMAIAAGTAAVISQDQRNRRAYQAAEEEKEHVEQLYEYNKKLAEEEFKKAKDEANRNADQMDLQANLTDKSLTQTEKGVALDFNSTIDQLYLSESADTFNWNTQAMQAGSSEGSAYAALGSSGIRAGSSLSDAVLMESATNAYQLQFAQDSTKRNYDNSLASVLSNLAGNQVNIRQNRIGADVVRDNASYLRNSYLEGGHNYNLYKNQLDTMEYEKNYSLQQLKKKQNENSGWSAFINNMTAFFGGASKGAQTGYNLGNMAYKSNNYTTNTGATNTGGTK